jgi:exopolysaccharide biosynthesis protein
LPKIQQIGCGQDWPGVKYAIGAGPNLVTNSRKNITQEEFVWYTEKAPRTAVATTSGGHTLLVTIDGRATGADGMTIDMLADFLVGEFHVVSAMNLDGGGSTTMYLGGKIVNKPSDQACDGCCRCVYDGLFVYMK